jgi:two-component system cell cycle response regulator
MTDSPSDKPPIPKTNGSIKGLQGHVAGAAEALDDGQTIADREGTLADADQTGSDRDQTAADSDQAAADSDQEASDQELAHGGDADEHDRTRDIRDRSTKVREQTAHDRLDSAAARDAVAHSRDLRATARDEVAAVLDRELATRDASRAQDGRALTAAEIVSRAAEQRRHAAADRESAAEGRARAAGDREKAARDREQAARDRLQAQADRDALLLALTLAETDPLTGARTRGAGLLDLDREIDRARRLSISLTVAFVDVVGLKTVNDADGHAAGDALLQRSVAGIRSHLRSYDLIVRLGGDEFLCVLSGASTEEAGTRFAAVRAMFAKAIEPCEIAVGFAALTTDDSATTLIGRADSGLRAIHPHGR